jgi:hypothetical protein
MNVQYLSNEEGERTGVYISMKDWEKIQKSSNTLIFGMNFLIM